MPFVRVTLINDTDHRVTAELHLTVSPRAETSLERRS